MTQPAESGNANMSTDGTFAYPTGLVIMYGARTDSAGSRVIVWCAVVDNVVVNNDDVESLPDLISGSDLEVSNNRYFPWVLPPRLPNQRDRRASSGNDSVSLTRNTCD